MLFVFINFSLLFALCIPAAWTQEDIFQYPLDGETMNSFTLTCKRLAEHPIITGNFEQEKNITRINRSLKSSGNFIIAADMGMVWDTITPFPSTLTLGSDYIIQSRPGGQKTMIEAQGNETFLRFAEVISMIFSGNAQKLIDNFDVFYYGSPAGWELGLHPKDRIINSFITRIIMRGDTAVKYIQIHEQNNDNINYILLNHKYPRELTAHEKDFFTIQ